MKKTALLNGALSEVVARMGHGDLLVLADAGLPVPPGVPVIDLAVTAGVPPLLPVLAAVLSELQVESFCVAAELRAGNPALHARIAALMPPQAAGSTCPHAEFKARSARARAVVRTGEFTAYANVMLCAGVAF
jgi:D-ribose pyranase